jgi:hypothetical protein
MTKTKAFYVRFLVPVAARAEAPATIDRFMNSFVEFLGGLDLGPTGDMSPSGQGVFLILGIDPSSASVIVDVSEEHRTAVDTWLGGQGVSFEVGKIVDIEIDPEAARKETP